MQLLPFITRLPQWVAGHKVVSATVLVVLLWAGYSIFHRATPTYETITVARGPFVQEVTVSGKVVAADDVDLGFAQGGRIARVFVKVGDKVYPGQTLAEVENADLRAALTAEQATLAALKSGTRPEEIAVSEAQVQGDRAALINAIQSAYATADSAVHNDADSFILSPRSVSPQLSFNVSDTKIKAKTEADRVAAESALTLWQASLATLTTASDLEKAATDAGAALSLVSTLLTDAQASIARGIPSMSVTQANLDTYNASISTARISVTSAATAVSAAAATLAAAEKSLALKKAGAIADDIAAAEARVDQARATLMKTVIVAPFSGTITAVNAKVGGTLAASSPAVSMIGSTLQIESYIPEVNIALVKVGDGAAATLDAYGPDISFPARVASVDPAETLKDGVSTYRTILQFATADPRLKAGMTAAVTITTDKKEGVIAVPQGVISIRDSGRFVTLLKGSTATDVEVTTGAISSSGEVEILSGLVPGDVVIVPAK